MPRPARAAVAATVVAAALPGALPYHTLIGVSSEADTLALTPLWWLQETVLSTDTIPVVVVIAAAVTALFFFAASPRYALALPLVVFAWFVFTTERVERFHNGFPKASVGALFQGVTANRRDWVDAAVGRNGDVAFVFSGAHPTEQPLTLWENEFLNRSIGPVYDLKQRSMGDLPETHVHQGAEGVLLLPDGRPVRSRYVLSDTSVPLAGMVIGRDDVRGMVLRRTDGLVAIASGVSGIYPDGWSGRRVTYTRVRCAGGTLTAFVASDTHLFSSPQTISAGGRSVRLDPSKTAALTVPLRPRKGVCRVVFTVKPTAVPAVVEHGSRDARVLGARFVQFSYSAP